MPRRLVPVIHAALAFDRQQGAGTASQGRPQQHVAELLASLTSREREVLNLVVNGQPTREIAVRLEISIKTVEFHRARIREKLGVSSMAELFKLLATILP